MVDTIGRYRDNAPQEMKDEVVCAQDVLWEKLDGGKCPMNQQQTFILQGLAKFIDWHQAVYEYPVYEDDQHYHLNRHDFGFEVGFEFLKCNTYQAWRERKVPGPGLLCVTGAGKPFRTKHQSDY